MGTSQKTFDQVKSILGKLDARIDNLRQRRAEPIAPVGTPGANGPSVAATGNGFSLTNAQQTSQTNGYAGGGIGPNTYIGGPAPQQGVQGTGQTPVNGQPGTPAPTAPPQPRSPYGRATPIRPMSA